MKNKEDIKEILDYLQTAEEKTLEFDDEAIAAAYQENDGTQSLAIKILSVFGGILVSYAFLVFLFFTVFSLLYPEVGTLVLGIICIAGAIWASKIYDKIIIDTFSISFYIAGFILLCMGVPHLFENIHNDINIICVIFILIAFASIAIAQSYILSFISMLIINGSILTLIIYNKGYDLIHIYVSVLALALAYFYLNEAKIITANKALSKLYSPIRIGLTFSFLAGLILVGLTPLHKEGLIPMSPNYIWLSSVVIIAVIIYLLHTLFKVLNITKILLKSVIYIFAILTLLPTAFSPAISGAILLILLSFLVNYKTGLVLGIIAFIYFISQYYYDLNFTLLTKSILLFSSGVLFLILYLFTHKKLTTNEKI